MNELKAMKVFVRCVERGNFSAVAKEFGTTQPNISKLVASLEADLGGSLLVRSTRGVKLTPQGERYYEDCRRIVDAIDLAKEGFGQARDVVAGRVRLSASVAFARRQLLPQLPALLQRYPMLEVDLELSDSIVDLVEHDIDLAFRFGELKDSALRARRVATTRRVTVAAPDYLRRHGTPRKPGELSAHQCIVFDRNAGGPVWTYRPVPKAADGAGASVKPLASQTIKVPVSGRFRTNSPESALEAALGGLGIAQISQWMIGEELRSKRLVPLLAGHALAESPIYAVSLQSARRVSRVAAVVDFYDEVFQKNPFVRR